MLCQNFAYVLEKRADCYPDDVAIVEGHTGQSYRYKDVNQRCQRLANALLDLGIAKGDRILSINLNTIEYFDIFFAAARIGAILVPVNYRLSTSEILRIIDDADPKMVLFDATFKDELKAIKDGCDIKTFVAFGGKAETWAIDYKTIMERYPEKGPPIAADSEDPFLMLFTAGSTGRPKGVPLSHRNLFFSSLNRIVDMGITRQDYTLTQGALFHIGGHILYALPHLHVGAKVVLYPRFEAAATLELIQSEKVTNTYLGPTKIKMMMQVPGWERYDLSSIRFIGTGGEPVTANVLRAFAKWDFPIIPGYGLTEASDGVLFLRPEHVAGKAPNCIGKTVTTADARVVDGQGNEAEPGEEGELLARGPTIAGLLLAAAEESARTFQDGWLHTGDRVVKDKEGFYYFLSRTDDMIKSGGENVFPAEVEDVICAHPGVAQAAVVGVPHERWGQTVKAVVVPKAGVDITADQVIEHVTRQLAGFKKPRSVQFVSSLPQLGSGKLDRQKIKEMYGKTA